MSFAKKNKIGGMGEKMLISALESYGFEEVLKNDDFDKRYDYDVFVTDPLLTFEVKYDLMFNLTKNVAIEYHNSHKDEPSGIIRSTADFWVHIVYINKVPTIFIANRLHLLKSIGEITPFKKIFGGGDKNSDMFIYKKDQMLSDDGKTPLRKMTKEVLEQLIGEL